jgi:hypothetical protein
MISDGKIPLDAIDAKKIAEMRDRGLDIGMRVDVLVSQEDIHFDDMPSGGWFVSSDTQNLSQSEKVRYVGRVSEISERAFRLVFGWNVEQNKPSARGSTSIQIYGNAVKEYVIDATR